MTRAIEKLAKMIRVRYPHATLDLEGPVGAGKTWWLDIAHGPSHAEIEWHPSRGFGLSANTESVYGAQSDETFSDVREILERVVELFDSGARTEESSEHFVRALREGRKLTQAELAKRLDVKQASVSRLENRADFRLSTLRNIVDSLGGSLEVRAYFSDGSAHILTYGKEEKTSSKQKQPRKANRAKKAAATQLEVPSSRTRPVRAGRKL